MTYQSHEAVSPGTSSHNCQVGKDLVRYTVQPESTERPILSEREQCVSCGKELETKTMIIADDGWPNCLPCLVDQMQASPTASNEGIATGIASVQRLGSIRPMHRLPDVVRAADTNTLYSPTPGYASLGATSPFSNASTAFTVANTPSDVANTPFSDASTLFTNPSTPFAMYSTPLPIGSVEALGAWGPSGMEGTMSLDAALSGMSVSAEDSPYADLYDAMTGYQGSQIPNPFANTWNSGATTPTAHGMSRSLSPTSTMYGTSSNHAPDRYSAMTVALPGGCTPLAAASSSDDWLASLHGAWPLSGLPASLEQGPVPTQTEGYDVASDLLDALTGNTRTGDAMSSSPSINDNVLLGSEVWPHSAPQNFMPPPSRHDHPVRGDHITQTPPRYRTLLPRPPERRQDRH